MDSEWCSRYSWRKKILWGVWIVPICFVAWILYSGDYHFIFGVTGSFLVIEALCLSLVPDNRQAASLLWYGLLCATLGDYSLILGEGDEFENLLYGIVSFWSAHTLWLFFFSSVGKFNKMFGFPLLIGYGVFYFGWLLPAMDDLRLILLVGVYATFSCLNLSYTLCKQVPEWKWFASGIGLLILSDTMIVLNVILHVSSAGKFVMPIYMVAILAFAIGTQRFTLLTKKSTLKNTSEAVFR